MLNCIALSPANHNDYLRTDSSDKRRFLGRDIDVFGVMKRARQDNVLHVIDSYGKPPPQKDEEKKKDRKKERRINKYKNYPA